MRKARTLAVVFALVLLLSAARLTAAGLEADMVVYNGKVITADSPDPTKFTVAQAFAVYDGKFIAVDIDTADYEIDDDDYAAVHRMRTRKPGARLWLMRAGHETTYRIARAIEAGMQ